MVPDKPPMPPTMPDQDEVEEEVSVEEEHPSDKIIAEVPTALTAFVIGVGVTVLCGLVYSKSVLLTVPVLTALGFWPGSIGFRILQTLPRMKNFNLRHNLEVLSTPLYKFGFWLIALACSPAVLLFFGLSVTLVQREPEGYLMIMLVLFGVIVIPCSLIFYSKAKRHIAG